MRTIMGKRYDQGRQFTTLMEMLRQSADLYQNQPAYLFRRKPHESEIFRSYRDLA